MMNYKEILIYFSLKYIINYNGSILFCMLNLIIYKIGLSWWKKKKQQIKKSIVTNRYF